MSRPRRQGAPDWPKSLQMPAPTPTTITVPVVLATPMLGGKLLGVEKPAPLAAFLFVRTKDGRHLAAEAQVDGSKVTALTPLCCSIHAQESAKAWEACAFARLCHGREYSATERHANAVQGKGMRLEDVAEGYAVALVKRAGKMVALAMEVEGSAVKEPKVLGSGDRLYAWQEAHAFAQRWFLPRRKA